ncbi:MAG: hypothetical protein HYS86_04210 [Candidatus Chisholmbacteria bacterium]|nr:hypothetical protein [Candidatus Chisholmbacteria bacterium]
MGREEPDLRTEAFVVAHQTEFSFVEQMRSVFFNILLQAARKVNSPDLAVVFIQEEFEAGYQGLEWDDYLSRRVRLDSARTADLLSDGEGEAVVDSVFKPSMELFTQGRLLRAAILTALPESSDLRRNDLDFNFFVRIVLGNVLLSGRN